MKFGTRADKKETPNTETKANETSAFALWMNFLERQEGQLLKEGANAFN